MSFAPPVFLYPLLSILAIGAVVLNTLREWWQRDAHLSRLGVAVSIAPSVFYLLLYYSLVIHMRLSLGHWPESIGDQGFPQALVLHERIVIGYYSGLIVGTVFVGSIAYLLSLLVRPWRRFAIYLGFHLFALIIASLITFIAPSGFLDWWMD